VLSNCNEAIGKDSGNTQEVLACHILFDPAASSVPFALGSLKTGYNVFVKDPYYNSNDVNILFVDKTMAVMIDKGCFQFDTSYSEKP